jgi:glycosyltransferase involved in cell wall biosynthesis
MPLVSIGLPTFNRAATLERAARSALAQDWPELELVISDNASADDTRAVCEALRALDSRVVYIRQDENLGPLRNFNEVLSRSRGELFMWLGDDDWVDPTYVSHCVRELLQNPDHSLVCGRARYYRHGVLAFAERPVNLHSDSPTRRLVGFYRQVTLNGAFYGVMRRDMALRQPLPDGMGGDWLFVARLAYLGKVRTRETTAIHRSLAGASQSAASLSRLHGERTPRGGWQVAVASNAFGDVRDCATYRGRSRLRRLVLGVAIYALVTARFSPRTWIAAFLEKLGLFRHSRRLLEWRRRRFQRG